MDTYRKQLFKELVHFRTFINLIEVLMESAEVPVAAVVLLDAVLQIRACQNRIAQSVRYYTPPGNQNLLIKIVTRPFCLVKSRTIKMPLKCGRALFTSFTFCNNIGSYSLRLNTRIYICIHSSIFYLLELAVMINLHKNKVPQ